MHFVVLSVLCSVAVSVLLKLARRLDIDVNQAIAVNYLVAAGATALLLSPQPHLLLAPSAQAAWPIIIALGILLPSIFVVLARAVRHSGVVRTDAAERLSLVVSLLAAFTLFGETLTRNKALGVVVGLVAVGCLIARRAGPRRSVSAGGSAWLWLAAVFLGFGAIDILFKRIATLTGVPTPTVLLATFTLAFVLAGCAIAVLIATGRTHLAWRHVGGGVVLGVLNFGNILFYIDAHRALPTNPALVFSAMNIGVIVVAALVGLVLFRERLNRWNQAGIVLAIGAVLLLT